MFRIGNYPGLQPEGARELAKQAAGQVALTRAGVAYVEGGIQLARHQLADLVGAGPDRGMRLRRPQLTAPAAIALPSLLPSDLNPQQAAVHYRGAVQHAPQLQQSYLRLAHLLERRLHQPRKAEEVLTQLIEKHPGLARGWYARASYRLSHDAVQEGTSDLAEALKRAPNDTDILRLTAQVCQQQLRPEDARICLQRGCKLQPRNATWHLGLASLELRQG